MDRLQSRESVAGARWTVWLAHAVPLCVLPSGLWRVALVLGVAGVDVSSIPVGEKVYIVSLSVVTEVLALLTLGLVRSWGEVLPRWVPLAGGRNVPVRVAVVPAAFGAVAMTLIWSYGGLNAVRELSGHPVLGGGGGLESMVQGTAYWVLLATYAPLLAWGPLLAVLTVAYYRRRTRRTLNAL